MQLKVHYSRFFCRFFRPKETFHFGEAPRLAGPVGRKWTPRRFMGGEVGDLVPIVDLPWNTTSWRELRMFGCSEWNWREDRNLCMLLLKRKRKYHYVHKESLNHVNWCNILCMKTSLEHWSMVWIDSCLDSFFRQPKTSKETIQKSIGHILWTAYSRCDVNTTMDQWIHA